MAGAQVKVCVILLVPATVARVLCSAEVKLKKERGKA